MNTVFKLPHDIPGSEWLSYSHDLLPPTDRQYVDGDTIMTPKTVRLANWYFLSDTALSVMSDSAYFLTCAVYDKWILSIYEPRIAVLFKLRFL